jgi:hypothetical protein
MGKTAIGTKSQTNPSPLLARWRTQLSDTQKKLIDEAWSTFRFTQKWPLLRPIYREHRKSVIAPQISLMPGFVREEEDHRAGNRLKLLLPGILTTNEGDKLYSLVQRYFAFQYELFQTESELRQIRSDEIQSKLELDPKETVILGELLQAGSIISDCDEKFSSWGTSTMEAAADFNPDDNFVSDVDAWINHNYYPQNPVFRNEQYKRQLSGTSIGDWFSHISAPLESASTEKTHRSDTSPFERKYQVFVSSTFRDLIEERKQVSHALLQTKCIPSGMELFPATNNEQMDLIEGVIDDCDYYVIILAGKYGSCDPSGISYTEREFDYAVSKGKHILAFYHNDIDSLKASQVEPTDEGKQKLARFTDKVKKQRLCKSWITIDGLASAITVSIYHAIQSDPKPGWVRADSVPTWSMVRELEKRIAELEAKPTPQP